MPTHQIRGSDGNIHLVDAPLGVPEFALQRFVENQINPPQPAVIPEPEDQRGDFSRGFGSVWPQSKALVGGTLGLLGNTMEEAGVPFGLGEGLRQYGMDVYERNMAEAQKGAKPTDDFVAAYEKFRNEGDFGGLLDSVQYWSGYGAGQALETIALAAAGSLAGGIGGGIVFQKQVAKGLIDSAVTRMAGELVGKSGGRLAIEEAKDLAMKQLAANATTRGSQFSQAAALYANAATQELGSIYGEAGKEGPIGGNDLARVWAFGTTAALLESAMDKLGIDQVMAAGKAIPRSELFLNAARQVGIGMAREGLTEAAQTGLERAGAGQSLTDEAAIRDYINSAVAGAIGGGQAGLIAGGTQALRRKPEEAPPGEVPPTTPPTAPAPPVAPPVPPTSVAPTPPVPPTGAAPAPLVPPTTAPRVEPTDEEMMRAMAGWTPPAGPVTPPVAPVAPPVEAVVPPAAPVAPPAPPIEPFHPDVIAQRVDAAVTPHAPNMTAVGFANRIKTELPKVLGNPEAAAMFLAAQERSANLPNQKPETRAAKQAALAAARQIIDEHEAPVRAAQAVEAQRVVQEKAAAEQRAAQEEAGRRAAAQELEDAAYQKRLREMAPEEDVNAAREAAAKQQLILQQQREAQVAADKAAEDRRVEAAVRGYVAPASETDFLESLVRPRRSLGTAEGAPGHSQAALTSRVADILGPRAAGRLMGGGKLRIITRAQADQISGEDMTGTRGFYNPKDGATYLVADNLPANFTNDQLHGLLRHELGVHALTLGRNSKGWQSILDQIDRMVKVKGSKAATAHAMAKKALAATGNKNPSREMLLEETAGYLVETMPAASITQRIIAWFKQALSRLGVVDLNEKDITALAQSALRHGTPKSRAKADRGVLRSGIQVEESEGSMLASVTANMSNLLRLLGSNLYSGAKMPQIALKEMYQNAFDAVKAGLAADIYPSREVLEKAAAKMDRDDDKYFKYLPEEDQARIKALYSPEYTQPFDYSDMARVKIPGLIDDWVQVTRDDTGKVDVDSLQKELGNRGLTLHGRIDINLNEDENSIEIIDNGIGMTRDTVLNSLLTLAGSTKESANASGGFGIAKAAFLFGNERLELETTRDGVTTTLSATGQDIANSASQTGSKLVLPWHKTNKPSGTRLKIWMPKQIEDENGKLIDNKVPHQWGWGELDSVRKSPLLHDIEVRINGETQQVGRNFPKDDYTKLSRVQFKWGTADVYVGANELNYGGDTYVLVNGLLQFGTKIARELMNPHGGAIKRDFILDFHPATDAKNPLYPFVLNRMGLKPHADKDLTALKVYLQHMYQEDQMASLADDFGSLHYITQDNGQAGITDTVELVRGENATQQSQFDARAGDSVEVTDGELVVNGRHIPLLTADDVKAYKADASKFRSADFHDRAPVLHDGVQLNGVPLNEVMQNRFGQRYLDAMFDLGKTFETLRDAVAEHYIPKIKEARDKGEARPVGVSLAFPEPPPKEKSDPKERERDGYLGVTVRIPFYGAFINPLGIQGSRPFARAQSAWTTMLHELVHFENMGHDTSFIYKMNNIQSTMWDKFDAEGMLSALQDHFNEYGDIYDGLRDVRHEDGFDIRGKSLAATGAGLQGDIGRSESGAPDATEIIAARGRGPGVSEGAATGAEQRRTIRELRGGDKQTQEGILQSNAAAFFTPDVNPTPSVAADSAKFLKRIGDAANHAMNNAGSQQQRVYAVDQFLRNVADFIKSIVFQSLPIHAIVDLAQKYIPQAREVLVLFRQHAGALSGIHQEMGELVHRAHTWARGNPERVKKFNYMVYEGTKLKVDLTRPPNYYRDVHADMQRQRDYEALKKIYDSDEIGDTGRAIYRMMRATYDRLYNELVDQIENNVKTTTGREDIATALKKDFYAQLTANGALEGYAPMWREGDHILSYVKTIPNYHGAAGRSPEPHFEMFETAAERNRRADELRNDPDVDQATLKTPVKFDTTVFADTPPLSFVGKVLGKLREAKVDEDTIMDICRIAIQMSPQNSLARMVQGRREVEGYRDDAFGAYERTAISMRRRLVNLKYGAQFRKLRTEIKEQGMTLDARTQGTGGMLANELMKRLDFASSPNVPRWQQIIKTLTYGWTLGFNVSSALIDSAAVPMVFYPLLKANHPGQNVGRAFSQAMRLYMGSKRSHNVETYLTAGLEGAELAAAQEKAGITGRDVSKVDGWYSMANYDYSQPDLSPELKRLRVLADVAKRMGQIHRMSKFDNLETLGEKVNTLDKINNYQGILMQGSERMRREVGMIAAYNLELEKVAKGREPTELEMQAAANKAINFIEETSGGTSLLSSPRFAQTPIGGILFMYKRYGATMYYMQFKMLRDMLKGETPEIRKAAKQQAVLTMITSAAFAGVQGMPMIGVVAALYNMFKDDEDDEWDIMMRKHVNPLFYEGAVNYFANTDVSSRIGLTNMLWRSDPANQDKTPIETVVTTLGGPTLGMIDRFGRGVKLIEQGYIERGIESLLPAALSNVFKSVRYATEGTRTLRGDPVTGEVNPFNVVTQAIGFAPADYLREQQKVSFLKRMDKTVAEKRNKLLEKLFTASRMGDTDEIRALAAEVQEFNKVHREHPITGKTLTASFRQRMKSSAQMIAGRLPDARRRQIWLDYDEAMKDDLADDLGFGGGSDAYSMYEDWDEEE